MKNITITTKNKAQRAEVLRLKARTLPVRFRGARQISKAMRKILVVWGNIEFSEDNMVATVHEIEHSTICNDEAEASDIAEAYQSQYGDYLIPQLYAGTIKWN